MTDLPAGAVTFLFTDACYEVRQDVRVELVQDLVETLGRFWRWLGQASLHLGPAGAADHGPVRDRLSTSMSTVR